MRARNIKPGFFKNADLLELPPLTRILFAGLWCMADKEGRLEDRPKQIKLEVIPADECDIESMLRALNNAGFITRYSVKNGVKIIQINSFKKHQNPHKREPDSTLPDMKAVRVPEKAVQVPEIPEPARLIPDSPSLIPLSPSPIPDSGSLIPKDSPASPKNATPPEHTKFVQGFKESYESMTGQPFEFKKEHFVIAARLVSRHGYDAVVTKAKILAGLCRDKSAWFTKDGWADFTIEKLSSQWNSILERRFGSREEERDYERREKARLHDERVQQIISDGLKRKRQANS